MLAVVEGVARPDSRASRSFRSIASARRLRKSESWTRPTVCADKRSSAVVACEVKRALGVDAPVESFDGMSARMRQRKWAKNSVVLMGDRDRDSR